MKLCMCVYMQQMLNCLMNGVELGLQKGGAEEEEEEERRMRGKKEKKKEKKKGVFDIYQIYQQCVGMTHNCQKKQQKMLSLG